MNQQAGYDLHRMVDAKKAAESTDREFGDYLRNLKVPFFGMSNRTLFGLFRTELA